MNRNFLYVLGYVASILFYLYLISIAGEMYALSPVLKILLSVIGAGGLAYLLLRRVHTDMSNMYRHIAETFNGKVEGKHLFSKKTVHFKYRSYPTTISYALGGQKTPSTTTIKMKTNFPQELKIDISYEGWVYKLKKITALEIIDTPLGEDAFEKKFKLAINGRDKSFLMSILSPVVREVLSNFLRKGPGLSIDGPEFKFHLNEIILNKAKLKEFYTFAFLFVDRVDDLLSQEG